MVHLPPSTVTRRCLPALGTMKGGVIVVGNETVFDAGEGTSVNASDILEASKWVLPTMRRQRGAGSSLHLNREIDGEEINQLEENEVKWSSSGFTLGTYVVIYCEQPDHPLHTSLNRFDVLFKGS